MNLHTVAQAARHLSSAVLPTSSPLPTPKTDTIELNLTFRYAELGFMGLWDLKSWGLST